MQIVVDMTPDYTLFTGLKTILREFLDQSIHLKVLIFLCVNVSTSLNFLVPIKSSIFGNFRKIV
jgi:hypothetical protein